MKAEVLDPIAGNVHELAGVSPGRGSLGNLPVWELIVEVAWVHWFYRPTELRRPRILIRRVQEQKRALLGHNGSAFSHAHGGPGNQMIIRHMNRSYNRQEAEAEIRDRGLHEMVFEVPAVDNEPHWHDFDAYLYLLDGTLHLRDVQAGVVHECSPGIRIDVPAKTVHAEQSKGYTVLLGCTRDPATFDEGLNRDPATLPD
jgi:hypothetical protein